MDLIRFNVPPYLGIEKQYINNAIDSRHISGDGDFTKSCHKYLEENFSIKKALLTTSGTAALDMAALLCNTENKMNVGGIRSHSTELYLFKYGNLSCTCRCKIGFCRY